MAWPPLLSDLTGGQARCDFQILQIYREQQFEAYVASYIIDTVTTFEVECINNQYITIVAEFVALSYSCVS